MSEKASSDLDIFDGLAAKKSRPAPPGAIPSVPPPPGSRVPPPSMTRQKTLLGLSAPGPSPSRPPGAPPPPPPSLRPQAAPPPPAPSKVLSPPPPPPPLGAVGLGGTLVTPVPSAPPPAPPLLSPPPPPPLGATPAPDSRDELTPPPAAAADAPKTNGAPKPGVDIDWDDEDEATTVFDRTQEDALKSLLRSAPPPPPPAAGVPAPGRITTPMPAAGVPAPSRVGPPAPRSSTPPPPSLPRAPLPPPPRTAPTSSMPAAAPSFAPPPTPSLAPAVSPMSQTQSHPDSPFERAAGQKRVILIAAAALAVVLVAVVVLLLPKAGSVVVTVAGPGNKAVSELEVLVDGKKVCATSPCQVKDLSAGIHLVKVNAPGYQSTADQAVKIASGDESALNVVLTRGSGGSGLSVRSESRGLKLVVDGKDIGPLPQELPDLAPGDHQVKIDGGDRYEPFEKTVTVSADQMLTLEPKLKVKKGLATIKPGLNADGARVVLVSGSERRPVPSLPLAVDIPGDKPYSVVATKRGFQDFEQKLEFEDGQAERTFVIDMVPPVASGGSEPAPASRSSDSGPRAQSHSTPIPTPGPATPKEPKEAKPAAAAGNGTLTLNSIPVSNVILDGRPLGPTPKLNVSVPAGSHTVIFVHPEMGRKAKSVTVAAGKSVPVVVKFP
ncbi:MAG: PEGA domain-containing protein [Myxococcota bacterium]